MKVKLRMMQGQFQKANGHRAEEVPITRNMYFMGSDASCNMRCPSKNVSPRHCAIMIDDGRVGVHDLNSETGVFVNDCAINGSRDLVDGDLLRVGSLEFEVLITGPPADDETQPEGDSETDSNRWRGTPVRLNTTPPEDVEKMDGDITDMLNREDAEARKHRLTNPDELRYDTAELQAINRAKIDAEIKRQDDEKARTASQAKTKRHKHAKPGKLPAANRPALVEGANPTEAAEDMLTKIFKPNQ